jgi:hypothetical protein
MATISTNVREMTFLYLRWQYPVDDAEFNRCERL